VALGLPISTKPLLCKYFNGTMIDEGALAMHYLFEQ
jgi:hypothetical protein